MILCPINRVQLLSALPKQAAVAEIGVAEGAFSAEILAACDPRRLTLIDPWEWQDREDYLADGNNVDADEQERRAQEVCARFANDSRVAILRDYSTRAAATFTDGELDWVYVDAVHSYDGTLSDLRSFYPKVAENGLILGHDFANHVKAKGMDFGVIEAVETFIAESGCHLLLVTNELYPTFVLAKHPDGPAARALMDAIFYNVPYLVEFDGPPTSFHQRSVSVGDRTRIVNGFVAPAEAAHKQEIPVVAQ